ncbi:hypothetical protein [Alteromonas gilva]|uniref:Uncharacterized protein n=1 Tax=Alteromonas gilva TaxID=2987522 RepID=A0ABT5L761_9ALTE|nr:hypothetical protein [Alteromonas gilva]MDC8832908.1 hypothetical protein [Alteromonas gilva]
MPESKGYNSALSVTALLVSIVAGVFSIVAYLKPDEYIAEGKYNNSNNKAGRFVECVDGDTMQSCTNSYFSDKTGELEAFSSDRCDVGDIDRSKSKHRCEIPNKVDVDDGHKCHVTAVCKRNN